MILRPTRVLPVKATYQRQPGRAKGNGLTFAAQWIRGWDDPNLVDVRVFRDCCADGVAVTNKDVDDTSREASLVDELSHAEGSQRCEFRRLEDNGVAGSQCRAQLPRHHHH